MNIFERAARKKLRFESSKGMLSVEQLFDVPLSSRDGFDLDCIARNVNNHLKAAGEESFVATKTNPAKDDHELRLDIVKHVIASKLSDQQAAATRAQRDAERARLTEILARKQDQALEQMDEAAIKKRLEELGA